MTWRIGILDEPLHRRSLQTSTKHIAPTLETSSHSAHSLVWNFELLL